MLLSELREGQAGRLLRGRIHGHKAGQRFVVVEREPSDRSSGFTRVVFEDTATEQYIWDYDDPIVQLIGKGTVKTVVTFDSPAAEGGGK